MADQNNNKTQTNLPKVFLHGPPKFSIILKPNPSQNFHIINPSSLPTLHQFLTLNPHQASSIDAIVTTGLYPVNADVIRLLPNLRLVTTPSAGTNHIDLSECRRRGIKVTNAGNLFSDDVADMAVALLIDVCRKISAADRFLRRRIPSDSWDFPLGSKLTGKHVGIIGMGKIGLEVAKRLEAFSCIISYNSRNKKPSISYPFYSNVIELATNTNALILCCDLNNQTKHIVNKQVMLALGKGGIIVNVGRGALIDENELVKCLMEDQIGGAGLDVFENEPHVPKELFSLDNVVLSPHAAVFTKESFVGSSQIVEQNLEAFFSNKSLITPVI